MVSNDVLGRRALRPNQDVIQHNTDPFVAPPLASCARERADSIPAQNVPRRR